VNGSAGRAPQRPAALALEARERHPGREYVRPCNLLVEGLLTLPRPAHTALSEDLGGQSSLPLRLRARENSSQVSLHLGAASTTWSPTPRVLPRPVDHGRIRRTEELACEPKVSRRGVLRDLSVLEMSRVACYFHLAANGCITGEHFSSPLVANAKGRNG
jgi:hypothetical protein